MKLLIQEPGGNELISEISSAVPSMEISYVSSLEEIKNALSGSEKVIVLLDIDSIYDNAISIYEELIDLPAASEILFSSEKYSARDLKELQKKGLTPSAFLKRPHQIETLIEVIKGFEDDLSSDTPLDMSKGGTDDIDIEGTLSLETSADLEEPASSDDEDAATKILNLDELSASLEEDGLTNSDDDDGDGLDLQFGTDIGIEVSEESNEGDRSALLSLEDEKEDMDFTQEVEISDNSPLDEISLDDSTATEVEFGTDEQNEELQINESVGEIELNIEDVAPVELPSDEDEDKDKNEEKVESDETAALEFSVDVPAAPGEETALTEVYSDFNTEEDNIEPIEKNELEFDEQEVAPPVQEFSSDEEIFVDAPINENQEVEDTTAFDMDDEKTKTAVASKAVDSADDGKVSFQDIKSESESIALHYDQELLKLKATIETLREEKVHLLGKLTEIERVENDWKFNTNTLQAEVEELKIELTFMKKNHEKQSEELKYRLQLSEEKRGILEERNKRYEQDLSRSQNQASFDTRKIQEREKVLESQLELLKSDSANIVRTRDSKILELKRKVDALEFDMDNLSSKAKKAKEERYQAESKLERIMATLRRTVGSIDEDLLGELPSDPESKLKEI